MTFRANVDMQQRVSWMPVTQCHSLYLDGFIWVDKYLIETLFVFHVPFRAESSHKQTRQENPFTRTAHELMKRPPSHSSAFESKLICTSFCIPVPIFPKLQIISTLCYNSDWYTRYCCRLQPKECQNSPELEQMQRTHWMATNKCASVCQKQIFANLWIVPASSVPLCVIVNYCRPLPPILRLPLK